MLLRAVLVYTERAGTGERREHRALPLREALLVPVLQASECLVGAKDWCAVHP